MAVVTISRQFGAGGKTLGEMVAKKLGYTFVDNEIIQMVAQKAKVSTRWVEFIEKEAGGKLLKFMTGLVSRSVLERVLGEKEGYIDEEVFIDLLNEIIVKIADEGNVVILGRGGQYILRDRKDVFHMLAIAHLDDRIRFMEKRYHLSTSQATQAVNREDKRRSSLYRKFGRQDYDHPDLYHVVLNMSKLNLEKARDIIYDLVTE